MGFTSIPNVAGLFPSFQRLAVWTPSALFPVTATIADPNGYVQKITTAGTSAATQPTWDQTVNGTTADGTIVWTNTGNFAPAQKPPDSLIQQFIDDIGSIIQSVLTRRFQEAIAEPPYNGVLTAWLSGLGLPTTLWQPGAVFPLGAVVLDSNSPVGAQIVTVAGTSGGTLPYFKPTVGATTSDGGVVWTNAGQTQQLKVLEAGNRYGAAHQLGVVLASFGITGSRDLAKHYKEQDWEPFYAELNSVDRRGEPKATGAFDFLFDPAANVISPRPGLLAIAGGDQPVGVGPAQEGLGSYFGKWGVDNTRNGQTPWSPGGPPWPQ